MNKLKKITAGLISVVMAGMMSITAFADEPYNAYSYDYWDDPIPAQNGYIVERTLTGADMGLAQLSDPESPFFISEEESANLSEAKDMYITDLDGDIFIVDTGNSRIIVLDKNYKLKKCYKTFNGSKLTDETGGEMKNLKKPAGIYVTKESTNEYIMYIADYENSRIVKADQDANIICEYTMPDSEVYTSRTFNPSKVVADAAGNVYAVVQAVNTGAVMFSSAGTFLSFYGANRVEVTASVRLQKIWRKFASDDQRMRMGKSTPVEYANFDIDIDGFIYTVTETANAKTDAVKKLNPAGYNIWNTTAGNEYIFGDREASVWYGNTTYQTRLTDIAVTDDGTMNVLDYASGRVFQYDKEANLLFIFGTSSDNQAGGFRSPNAVDTYETKVMVLDGSKNDITVFQETVFGSYVHSAVTLHNEGRYDEAIAPWQEVMKRDGNYVLAYTGIGRALLNQGEYKQAMEYFENAFNQKDYDRAFEGYRQDWLREHFTLIVILLIAFVVIVFIFNQLKKRGIIKMPKFSKKSKKGAE